MAESSLRNKPCNAGGVIRDPSGLVEVRPHPRGRSRRSTSPSPWATHKVKREFRKRIRRSQKSWMWPCAPRASAADKLGRGPLGALGRSSPPISRNTSQLARRRPSRLAERRDRQHGKRACLRGRIGSHVWGGATGRSSRRRPARWDIWPKPRDEQGLVEQNGLLGRAEPGCLKSASPFEARARRAIRQAWAPGRKALLGELLGQGRVRGSPGRRRALSGGSSHLVHFFPSRAGEKAALALSGAASISTYRKRLR